MNRQKGLNSQIEIDKFNKILDTVERMEQPSQLDAYSASRRKPAHGLTISSKAPTIVYVTVCCNNRVSCLAQERHHELLLKIWQDTSHWVVGRYVLMPDHLHLFAAPQESAVEFDAWVQYFKSQFTKRNKNPLCVWQTDHWDTRIRSESHYEEKSHYMVNNPVRAGLVVTSDLWEFQGIAHEIRWE